MLSTSTPSSGAVPAPRRSAVPAVGRVAVLAVAGVQLTVHLAVAGRWGFHRDEPYYLVGGRHLDWGYVDHPPLVPALARLSEALFGQSLVGLRLWPALASAGVVVLAAVAAATLGGGRRAQVLAALAVLVTPLYLATGHWFQTVPFDQLLGAAALVLWLRLLAGADPRWWLAVGAVLGVGLQTKWTALLVAAVIAVGTLAHAPVRRRLAEPWPWLGVGAALLLWLPNLVWQAAHGWPTLEFIAENGAANRADGGTVAFVVDQLALVGPVLLPLAVVGAVWCWRRSPWRAVVLGIVPVLVGLLAVGAKGYYPGPLWPLLLAAGAVAADRWVDGRSARWRGLVVAMVANGLVPLVVVLPVLSPTLAAAGPVFDLNEELAGELGYEALTARVADALDTLHPAERAQARVLARSYSVYSAVELFGPDLGIRRGTALSGHNSAADWWPDHQPRGAVIAVGWPAGSLTRFYGDCDTLGRFDPDQPVDHELVGLPLAVCREPLVAPGQLREQVRTAR